MTKKALTLDNIGELIDKKLATIHHQLIQLTGESVYVRKELETIKSDTGGLKNRIDSLDTKVETGFNKLKAEMNKRFDLVGDQLQVVLQAASDITDSKLEKFREKYLPA